MKIGLTVFLSLALVSALASGKFSYIGSKKCMLCHKGPAHHNVWEKWEASGHAKAFAALNAAKGEDQNPECLACHTTGFKAGGYELGAANAKDFENVGCEVCHGPGVQGTERHEGPQTSCDQRLGHSR